MAKHTITTSRKLLARISDLTGMMHDTEICRYICSSPRYNLVSFPSWGGRQVLLKDKTRKQIEEHLEKFISIL